MNKTNREFLLVKEKICNECLFSDNKIVSDKRKEELLHDIWMRDTYFVCHKSKHAMCKGFFDKNKKGCLLIKLALILHTIKFVK